MKNNLILRSITGVLFVALLVAGITLHPYAYALLFTLITALATWEFCTILNNAEGLQINRFITTVASVILFLSIFLINMGLFSMICLGPYIITILYLLVSELYNKNEKAIYNLAFSFMTQLYIALPFALFSILIWLAMMMNLEQIWWYQLALFIFLWTNDSGAYAVGVTMGKHRLFPSVSPKKSWEGSIGGGITAIIASQVIAHFTPFVNIPDLPVSDLTNHLLWAGMALVVVVTGTWGDLVESLIKRKIGIKDSGNILPGHGGMLDRFDSSLIAIPATVLYIHAVIMNL